MRNCTAPHCADEAAGYSGLCERHRRQKRRHGDPLQVGIKARDLQPHRARIAARRTSNAENEAWAILGQRWEQIAASAARELADMAAGVAGAAHKRRAAALVQKLAAEAEGAEIVDTALAMYLLADREPGRFRSDAAFRTQLARRVLALSDRSAGSHWDGRHRKLRKAYRELPPRVLQSLASLLAAGFGAAGIQLAGIERRATEQAAAEREALTAAIERLR